jgi:glycosyltransferase involved in cell wall biosynthesis
MKILMLSSGTIHSSLSHRLLSLATQLVKHGHTVTIVAPKRDKYSKFELDTPESINGIQMIYPSMLATNSAVLNLVPYLISSVVQVLKSRAQLVYIYKPTPITLAGLAAKIIHHIPLITDMDDLGSEVMAIEGHPAFMTKLVSISERIATKYATGLVVASTLLQGEFTKLYPSKPILLISNGVNAQELTVKTRTGQPHIVFFGAINRERIVGPLIDSLPAVIAKLGAKKVIVDIIGDGSALDDLRRRAKELHLDESVTFHGWKTIEQMTNIARRGDIGVCIMPQERTTAACSNQKVFQYQAMGLSVIATRVGDLPLYLDNGKAGILIDSNDAKAVAAALTLALSDTTLRTKNARSGEELARTTYSWSTLGTQLSSYIKRIA